MNKDKILNLYRELDRNFTSLIGPNPFSAANNLRLERITHLLSLLGNPHFAYPSIHVGGTSGKGSTSAMIAAMLTAAGYKTGLHLSPHLQIFNERHQVNTRIASTSRLTEVFEEMKPAIARVAAESPFGAPSYFEAQTALAFLLFQREEVDVAVVEVGLGGTLDATNVLPSSVAVLTNVGLDHTAILGRTVEQIARDKSGIIKTGQTVISGVRHSAVEKIVAHRCQTQNARLLQLDQNFSYILPNGHGLTLTTPTGTLSDVQLGMPGDFQVVNAACAVAAVQSLPGFTVPEAAIRAGLQNAKIPGRVEVMQTNPTVILDGAHNPEKMRASQQAINKYYGDKRRVTVLSLKSDKAARDVLAHVLADTDMLITTEFKVSKSLWKSTDAESLARLAAEMAPNLEIRVVSNPMLAFQNALDLAGPDDLVWVTGSFYLVGNVREYWYPARELLAQAETGLSGALVRDLPK